MKKIIIVIIAKEKEETKNLTFLIVYSQSLFHQNVDYLY